MSARMIAPSRSRWLDIRCTVSDAIVANLAVHFVFFFERHLETPALEHAFVKALNSFPMFAGRMATVRGEMHIRCEGQGVRFSSTSSTTTLRAAIRAATTGGAGLWLVDPVNATLVRSGRGPLCTVRITHLADGATALGLSWHHAIGDMQTFMRFMNAWAAAAAGDVIAEPVVVEDRVAYLDEHLPDGGAGKPGVRCMSWGELARGAWYLARDARKQRTLSVYFGDDEIARMLDAHDSRIRLSTNDVLCAHVAEALMAADSAVDRRTLSIAVNARTRCGLDPMLAGNIITTLNLDLRSADTPDSIAERIRRGVDAFVDEHCDLRVNQRFLDSAGRWRAARCVSVAFDATRWNPLISNLSGFGAYRIRFDDTCPTYCTPLLSTLPVAGLGTLLEGAHGRGLVFQMVLPPAEFDALSSPDAQVRLHRYRHATDDTRLEGLL